MKLSNIVALLALITTGSSFGASGIYQSFGIIKINASTSYYDMEATTGNPDFQGASFGTFDTTVGNTLTLVGGEINTFKNSGSDVTAGFFDYRVFKVGDTPGSFIEFSLPYNSELGGNNQKWDKTNQNANLLTGLSNGVYTLEVYARANTSDGGDFSSNGGSNYTASFTVVPEPTSTALGLLGTVLLLRRQRA